LSQSESDWLDKFMQEPDTASEDAEAARLLVGRIMARLSPEARLVVTLLEIEDRTVKEIAEITGWSVPLVKVRAFRARAEMRKILAKITAKKYM
jgi:RNA polymerase sigma-70 factor (ECF subfamily)